VLPRAPNYQLGQAHTGKMPPLRAPAHSRHTAARISFNDNKRGRAGQDVAPNTAQGFI
jgi:hypothetical protein